VNAHELRAAPAPPVPSSSRGCSRSWCCASTGSAPCPLPEEAWERGGMLYTREAALLSAQAAVALEQGLPYSEEGGPCKR
jgi:hypothetical protein